MRARVIDIETTGTTPETGEIIEAGRVDVVASPHGLRLEKGLTRLYQPLHGIPAITRAVHHIGPHDIPADAPVCTAERLGMVVRNPEPPTVLVAHNAAFEASFIGASVTREIPWVCTYKVALRVLPDAVGHSNQTLRYHLDLPVDPALAHPPHRALPDAYVTAHLLVHLFSLASLEQMIKWSAEPKLYPRVPFGKHRNTAWPDVDTGYLEWMVRAPNLDTDAAWCAGRELERRASSAAATQADGDDRRACVGRFGRRRPGLMRAAGLPAKDDAVDVPG